MKAVLLNTKHKFSSNSRFQGYTDSTPQFLYNSSGFRYFMQVLDAHCNIWLLSVINAKIFSFVVGTGQYDLYIIITN